jgi:cyclopropane fatty-acyl-phospholipid synthase-like methyltransferase
MFNKLDYTKIKHFWDQRARRDNPVENIGNLEDDPELSRIKVPLEEARVMEYLTLGPDLYVLDLGCGSCFWSIFLAKEVRRVVAVDFSKDMLTQGVSRALSKGITNIDFVQSSCQEFVSKRPFDIIFISGLFLYLNDSELETVMSHISGYSMEGTKVLFRDGTGMGERYEFTNRYSPALKAYYSATYRTRDDFIRIFRSRGFDLVKDDDMFPGDSPLNKYPETRLRIYLFKKH